MKFRASVEATFGFPTYESGFLGPKKRRGKLHLGERTGDCRLLLGDLLYRASA